MTAPQPEGSTAGPLARLAALVAVLALAAALAGGFLASDEPALPAASLDGAPLEGDPFAYEPDRRGEFEARAAAGVAHVLYANSPGGASQTAQLVARQRDRIERATQSTSVDPDVLEAMVYLESAGRSQVIAGDDPEAAAGLAQIVASTATDLLGMEVDLEASRALTKQINRAYEFGQADRAERLTAERARIDERFNPEAALAGAVRYLEIARQRFASDELAVVSYHMGIGNLEQVIANYLSEEPDPGGDPLPYAELYFNSSPLDHPETWGLLASFGDESSEYLWKVRAAETIMRLHRDTPEHLRELEQLHGGGPTGEQAFHPPDSTPAFESFDELQDAFGDGVLVATPESPRLGIDLDDEIARMAQEAAVDPAFYRGLRPEAVVTLIYLAGRTRDVNGGGVLRVTATARDRDHEARIEGRDPLVGDHSPLHATGWSFDIARDYESDDQAQAFQFALDRLQALALIDYAVEDEVIHITASGEVGPLLARD